MSSRSNNFTVSFFSIEKLKEFRIRAINYLKRQINETLNSQVFAEEPVDQLKRLDDLIGIPPFYIQVNPKAPNNDESFVFSAPTTRTNAVKLLRALQLNKPLLLEGSPGVGKTSLVSALARASGHEMLRINLSDQTVS